MLGDVADKLAVKKTVRPSLSDLMCSAPVLQSLIINSFSRSAWRLGTPSGQSVDTFHLFRG